MVRKIITFALAAILMVAIVPTDTFAQGESASTEQAADLEDAEAEGIQLLKQRFIEGGPFFMSIVLICLILGLALCIERVILPQYGNYQHG